MICARTRNNKRSSSWCEKKKNQTDGRVSWSRKNKIQSHGNNTKLQRGRTVSAPQTTVVFVVRRGARFRQNNVARLRLKRKRSDFRFRQSIVPSEKRAKTVIRLESSWKESANDSIENWDWSNEKRIVSSQIVNSVVLRHSRNCT